MTPVVTCVGELLWDVLPAGRRLGGAPANVAFHLGRLGVAADVVTRVGDDEPGRAALESLAGSGLDVGCVQVDASLPTGAAYVRLDGAGRASYGFETPAAWDAIEAPGGTREVVVFGTLAQRDARSARTIRSLAAAAHMAVYDVNLRPPWTTLDAVSASLALAHVVKVSDDEVAVLSNALDLPAAPAPFAAALAVAHGLDAVCVTLGAAGAGAFADGAWVHVAAPRIEVVDTIGAGDAFLAAFVEGRLAGRPLEATLRRAVAIGSRVAELAGAMPDYDPPPVGG